MHSTTRSLWLPWLLLSLVLLTVVALLSLPGPLHASNAWVQDRLTRLRSQAASADVVLVLIDERSMATIGRWPWRRALHAQVLRQIAQGQPLAIGLDVLFTEEDWDYPEDDALLAQTLAALGRVVLPVVPAAGPENSQLALQPLPLLARSAHLGHTEVLLDADGSVRRWHPWRGSAAAPWPHFTQAMLCLGQPAACAAPASDAPLNAAALQASPAIGFARATPRFTQYAYVDVLQGRIPASAFRHKWVLIGSNATGVAPTAATPGAPDQAHMSNVELLAHILHSRLTGSSLQPAPSSVNVALNVAWVLAGLLAVLLLGPTYALLACLVLALAVLASAWLASWGGWLLQPSAAWLGLAAAYPLWSWRRQTAALQFLEQETRTLQAQGVILAPAARGEDFFQQHITVVEQALTQMHRLQAQREQAMRFISHDIRAPVSAILTQLELERHGLAPQDGPPLLERIERNAHSALRLADDFVHLARSLEQPSTRCEVVELGLLIDQALDDVWAAATQRHMQLLWLAQEHEALVLGDASQLRRALVNLLTNAIKYSPAGSAIDITLQLVPAGWQIQVGDHGPGIDAEALPRLFTPFARQQRHEGGPTPGIGLGLAYVHTVLTQHGGSISVANRTTGSGAVFTATLPQAQGEALVQANVGQDMHR